MKIQKDHPPFDFNESLDVMSSGNKDKSECTAHYLIRENSMRLLESELDGLMNKLHAMGTKHGIDVDLDSVAEEEIDDSMSPSHTTEINNHSNDNKTDGEAANESTDADEKTNEDEVVEEQEQDSNEKQGKDTEMMEESDEVSGDCEAEEVIGPDDPHLIELQSKVDHLNKVIQEAIDNEDYELADEKDGELNEINLQIESITNNVTV